MNTQMFYIKFDSKTHFITAATQNDKSDDNSFTLAAINNDHLADFKSNYGKYKFDPNKGVVLYPSDLNNANLIHPDLPGSVTNLQLNKADKDSLTSVANSASTGIAGNSNSVASLSTNASGLDKFVSDNKANVKNLGNLQSEVNNKAEQSDVNKLSGSASAAHNADSNAIAAIQTSDKGFAENASLTSDYNANSSAVGSLSTSTSDKFNAVTSNANIEHTSLSNAIDNITANSSNVQALSNVMAKAGTNISAVANLANGNQRQVNSLATTDSVNSSNATSGIASLATSVKNSLNAASVTAGSNYETIKGANGSFSSVNTALASKADNTALQAVNGSASANSKGIASLSGAVVASLSTVVDSVNSSVAPELANNKAAIAANKSAHDKLSGAVNTDVTSLAGGINGNAKAIASNKANIASKANVNDVDKAEDATRRVGSNVARAYFNQAENDADNTAEVLANELLAIEKHLGIAPSPVAKHVANGGAPKAPNANK